MEKETWKKCPACDIFTDGDEKSCPRYGAKEGHKLENVELNHEEVVNLRQQKKIFTKHQMVLIGI